MLEKLVFLKTMIIICRHEIVRKNLKSTTLIPVGVAADHLDAEVVAVAGEVASEHRFYSQPVA